MLTVATAQKLLAPIADSPVQTIQHITNTNDVFKVVTERHGNFFVKFHTSPWYKEAPDTYIVVQREAAVAELLTQRHLARLSYLDRLHTSSGQPLSADYE